MFILLLDPQCLPGVEPPPNGCSHFGNFLKDSSLGSSGAVGSNIVGPQLDCACHFPGDAGPVLVGPGGISNNLPQDADGVLGTT